MIQVPFRSAKLVLMLRNTGNNCDVVYAEANYGDLRIEVDVSCDEWPRDKNGYLARRTEVELT